ncbi:hypothetical protein [Jannaschia aquimarina]|uniref:hypothetical protein n=1 Tax=Jannaschia aquimarina TaxID=935700 RepID=UPI000B0BECF5|nr:hypothetical protein [Jannaschia aquimarina]
MNAPTPKVGKTSPALRKGPSAAFAVDISDVPPPVGASRLRFRHVALIASFLSLVLVPVAVAAWYLWAVAADQYASRVGFSVRQEDSGSALDLLGGLSSLSGSSSSTDTDILYEFIQSQRLVADLDAELDLRAMWSKPDSDPVFALPAEGPIEELVDYWGRMVTSAYGTGPGLLEIEVRAFTPEDAFVITNALFERSSQIVNDISAIARDDSIRYARDDLTEAEERLRTAREQLTLFRNRNQLVNPELDLQSQAGLLSNLQQQQATALIEIDLLADQTSSGDPRLEQARRRLEVIERRIEAERQKLGFGGESAGGRAFADLVGEYERLAVDREFAETAYTSALAAYDGALAEARRQTRYLAAYTLPTLAETPEYPRRVLLLAMIAGFLFLAWSILVLIIYSLRDRR